MYKQCFKESGGEQRMSDAVIVAIITGTMTLIGVIISTWSSNRSISKDLNDIKEENKHQSLDILRLTVMSRDMPISERLIAGKKYLSRGGNGDVKKYYEQLVKEHTK